MAAVNDGSPLDRADTRKLETALALFRDSPLPGVDWPWAQAEIRQLRATYVELLERVGCSRLGQGNARSALRLAERGLSLDELNEALWRLAMAADCANGLRDSANERFERLRTLLDQQFGLEPDGETRALYRELLGQR